MPLIRFLIRTEIQASNYAEGQVVLLPNDLAADVVSSGCGEEAPDETIFVEHVNRIVPDAGGFSEEALG